MRRRQFSVGQRQIRPDNRCIPRATTVSALCEALTECCRSLSALCEALFFGEPSIAGLEPPFSAGDTRGCQEINASHNADRPPQASNNASHKRDTRRNRKTTHSKTRKTTLFCFAHIAALSTSTGAKKKKSARSLSLTPRHCTSVDITVRHCTSLSYSDVQ
jgi:hypothetical protein